MKKILKTTVNKLGYNIKRNSLVATYEKIYNKYKDFTMIPENLYFGNLRLVEEYIKTNTGDIIECGVWRGGMIAGIADLLGTTRTYYLFDSFEGLPEAREIDGQEAIEWQKNVNGSFYHNNCTAEIEYASKAMGLSKTDYHLIKGWFNVTLPKFKSEAPIALLRLDGDWYDSTIDCLKYLYPRVQKGGLIILDDYYAWDGCSRAVHDYLSSIKSMSRIFSSSEGICYILKKDEYEQ